MTDDLQNIHERLDRGLCNRLWLELFPDDTLTHLARTYSDHCPILLRPVVQRRSRHVRLFRILKAWFLHPQFWEVVEEAWIGVEGNIIVENGAIMLYCGTLESKCL